MSGCEGCEESWSWGLEPRTNHVARDGECCHADPPGCDHP